MGLTGYDLLKPCRWTGCINPAFILLVNIHMDKNMRNISFRLNQQKIKDMTKDVARHIGFLSLKPGDKFQPIEKHTGFKDIKPKKIGRPVIIKSIHREQLRRMIDDPEYGKNECKREGFPEMSPAEFVSMFCSKEKNCTPESIVTRIEFSYKTRP